MIPDIAHVDKLTIVIRYIAQDGNPVERTLECLPNGDTTAKETEVAVLEFVKENAWTKL